MVGYEYQTLHGIQLLCEWLDSPSRYLRVRFECTDKEVAPRSLDDIVAIRADELCDYWQVKYTPNPENNLLTWDWLLHVEGKTQRARSNIKKWFDAIKAIDAAEFGTAQLITNRVPDRGIEESLAGTNYLNLDKAPADVQARLTEVFGSKVDVVWFFSKFRIIHSDKNYLNLSNSVANRLLHHTDAAGVERLKSRSREWVYFENQPHPDGWITLEVVRSIISSHRPQPIPQDFTVPDSYQAPEIAFHESFLADVEGGTDSIITLCGPPGRGKSTYLSYVCEALQSKGIPVVRHHYFLSPTDRTVNRFSPYIVRESLLGQISRFHNQSGAKTDGDVDLHEALATCAAYYKTKGKRFVVLIDGLDHVWRENSFDKEPLDDVFKQLIPAADNMVVIVGTQLVADAQLPDRLLAYSPRSTWKELPPMSAISVMNYLQNQVEIGRLQPRNNVRSAEDLAEGAHELHKVTGGHPLHVIYATEHLINNGDGLSKWSVEQIPGDLSKDVKTYYQSLWLKLTYAQRDVLILLAEFRFHWPSDAFIGSQLLPSDSPEDLRAVEHLLHSTAAGLAPFHDSLVVFVKADAEFVNRVKVLTPKVEHWLQGEAPARLRNMWLWSVQARLGNTDNLISGLTRDWILDRLTDGYAIDVPIALLAEAEVLAFDQRRYADAYRLRHLKTRLLNGPEFQIPDDTRLKVCSWKLAQDSAVLDEALATRQQLSVVELAGLGLSLQSRGLDQEGADCGAEALRRHRGDSRFAVDRHDSIQLREVLDLGKAFGVLGSLELENITPKGALNAGDFRLAVSFITGATSKMDLGYLIALREKLTQSSRRKLVEDASIRVAALVGIQIHRHLEFTTFFSSTIAGCYARLVGASHDVIPCSPLPMSWYDSTDRTQLASLTHEWFFKTVLIKLAAEGPFSWIPCPPSKTDYRAEIPGYLDAMTRFAEQVAKSWSKKRPVSFADFYTLFEDLPPPGRNESNKYHNHSEFCRTLVQIGLDCQAVSAALGAPACVDVTALESASRSAWFNLHHFRVAYLETGIKLVTDDAAIAIIHHGRKNLSSRWAETSEHAEMLLELCEIALMHEMAEEARQLCRLSWDYVLGYGNHKDVTIISLLEAIDYLSDVAPLECRTSLSMIAPQVHHVTDYTDGDETRHAHSYVNDLLAKLSPFNLAEKYAVHINDGDWSYADDAFSARFSADLSSPVLEAIVRTGLPTKAILNLRTRAEKGDSRAAKLYDLAVLHSGAACPIPEEATQRDDSHELKEFQGKPEDYPPETFDSLVQDMSASGFFGAYSYLPKWYGYWSVKGRDSDLLRVLGPRLLAGDCRKNDVCYMLDQAFESSLKLNGKDKAFRYAVQAQKEMGGWLDFYEQSENSERRLQRVADLYPKRADEFIAASCIPWQRNKREPSSRVIPSEKLVFFLVRLGRLEEANALVTAMISAIQGDTRNLPLTAPSWASDMTPTAISLADIRLLVARTKWPVPAVKWWAIQELANLLTHPLEGCEIEKELYRVLELSKLETEVVELLFIYWLATQAGYVPSPALSTYVRARSPLSSLILADIFNPILDEGKLRTPLIEVPFDFEQPLDFQEAQGATVPRIFSTLLESLEDSSGFPFIQQFAYEWANTATLNLKVPLYQDIGYFYGYPAEEMSGQFVVRATHRGRSAYLRTLSVAQDIWGAPEKVINSRALPALPFDPTFSALQPIRPDWIMDWDATNKVEPQTIEEFLLASVRKLQETSKNSAPLALSLPLRVSETEIIELEAVMWVQWEMKPVDGKELLDRVEKARGAKGGGWCNAEGLSKTIHCPMNLLEDVIDSEVCAAPSVGEQCMWRRGYLHSDLYSRGIFLPLPTVKKMPVSVRPKGRELEVLIGDSPMGQWSYWNVGWAPSHPRLARAFCATSLIADKAMLNLLWAEPPIRHFLLWRCTTISRENTYSTYSSDEIVGVFFV